jgi:hypothetical protein
VLLDVYGHTYTKIRYFLLSLTKSLMIGGSKEPLLTKRINGCLQQNILVSIKIPLTNLSAI